jgi:excisionase family DNA binding protein
MAIYKRGGVYWYEFVFKGERIREESRGGQVGQKGEVTRPDGVRTTIKAPEISQRLGVCEPTVRDLLRKQIIPNVRYGRIWIVSRNAFERWEQNIGVNPGKP